MAQITIAKPEDLAKFNGWQIDKAEFGQDGSDPVITFTLRHIAAEFPVTLMLKPTITFGRAGNIMLANTGINITTQDIK